MKVNTLRSPRAVSVVRSKLSSWYTIANEYLHAFYRTCGSSGCAIPIARNQQFAMSRGKVLSLEEESGVESLTVKSGKVWVTSTPAKGDIVLTAGESFELKRDWPFVIEAIEDAELTLCVTPDQ